MTRPAVSMANPEQDGAVRRSRMIERLRTEGRIDVNQLAEQFGVARETVRRDLRTLQIQGELQRVHGGAVITQLSGAEAGGGRPAEDIRIGSLVWQRMPRSGTLLIGAGQPGRLLAEAIAADPPTKAGLTVITSSLDIAVLLSKISPLSVYNLGGSVTAGDHAQEGAWPIEELRRLRVDVCLISPDGIDIHGGLTCRSPSAAAIAQAEVSASDRLIVLADPRILGQVTLVRFAEVDQITELIVPSGLDSPALADLIDLGVVVPV